MKKQLIYLDTSVFGGFFDDEFQEFTKPLFNRINGGEFKLIFSTLLEKELELAPEKVRKLVRGIDNDETEFVMEPDNAIELATEYITEEVVGKTSFSDCLHIALATINQADLLISWSRGVGINIL